MLPIPMLLRVARRLEAIWTTKTDVPTRPERAWRFLHDQLAAAETTRHRLERAAAMRLASAATSLRSELHTQLKGLGRRIDELRDACETPAAVPPDRCEWIRELRHLETEFGTTTVLWTKQVIRVMTEPIELQGVSLGSFAIEFNWGGGPESGVRAFEAKAMQPNHPPGRDDVTHPHVEDDVLCTGSAKDALEQAVADGRLVDAFQIVHSGLTSYNPHSAYVPLRDWDGTQCSQCGSRVRAGEASTCEGCHADLCDECGERCEACDELRCGDCLEPCDVCRERHCRGTLSAVDSRSVCPSCCRTCRKCGTSRLADELDADGLCPDCSPEVSDDDLEAAAAAEEVPL